MLRLNATIKRINLSRVFMNLLCLGWNPVKATINVIKKPLGM